MEFDVVKSFTEFGVVITMFVILSFVFITTTKKREEDLIKDGKEREEKLLNDSKERENRILNDSKEREDKLYAMLNTFSAKYDDMAQDIKEIKAGIMKK